MLAHMNNTRIMALEYFVKDVLFRAGNLPIEDLASRKDILCEMVHVVVDAFTDKGRLTEEAGGRPLEAMEWWDELNTFMFAKCGMYRVGNGHFSAVYAHSLLPKMVIKVGFKKEDSGAAYAAFCRANAGMTGLPVIHTIQRTAGCYTVVMDEYHKFDVWESSDAQDVMFNMVGQTVKHGRSYEYLVEWGYIEEYDTSYARQLHATALKIHEFFVGIAEFDMHSGNVMLDSKGNLVITDPVSFTCEEEQ